MTRKRILSTSENDFAIKPRQLLEANQSAQCRNRRDSQVEDRRE